MHVFAGKSLKESSVSSCKYRRWKINADGGTAAGWSQAVWYIQWRGWDTNIATRWGMSGVFIGPPHSGWHLTVSIARELCITSATKFFHVHYRPDPTAGGTTEHLAQSQIIPLRLETLYVLSILQDFEVQLLSHNIHQGNSEHVNFFIN